MNLFRRMLGWIGLEPKAAVGYRSVRVALRDGGAASQGSGDYHARYDRLQLLPMSREYFRDNALYRGMISRFAGYIVGGGFGLQAKTSKPEWNREAERVWNRFWRRPEIRQTMSGRGLERMVAQEILLCGDVGIVKTDLGLLQLIEAEQIAGPNLSDDGIKRNEAGAPTSYWYCPYSKTGSPNYGAAREVSAENMLFLVNPERPTSTRGVPPSQSAFSMLKRINDVCDSEAQAWNLLSRLAISITRQQGPTLAATESALDTTKDPEAGDVTERVQIFDGVSIFHGEPGDEIKGIERNIPSQNFTESLTTFLRLLGLPLGLPLEFVMLDWTKSNYSQCRAILEQVSVTLRDWQMLLEEFFYRPVYEWAIARAMESGELALNDEWDAHEWIYPSFPWIDQLKEAEAHGLQVDRGYTTHAAVVKGKGLDREEVVNQIETEILDAIARAEAIKAKTGVNVPYEIFCGRMAAGAPPPAADPAATEDEAPGTGGGKEKPAKKESLRESLEGDFSGAVDAGMVAGILRARRQK